MDTIGKEQDSGETTSTTTEDRPARRAGPRQMFASFAYRDFVYLWLGQITHAAALWLEQTARPLLILALTGSPVHLGMVILVRTIPSVAFGLIAGVIADNFDRRTILVATKVVVLVLSIVFAIIVYHHPSYLHNQVV